MYAVVVQHTVLVIKKIAWNLVPTDAPDFSGDDIKITRQTQTVKFDRNGATVTVSAAGPGTLSYTWLKDGKVITSAKYPNCTGADTDTLTISPFTPEYEGNYNCRIGNQDGLSIESEVTTVKMFGGTCNMILFKILQS